MMTKIARFVAFLCLTALAQSQTNSAIGIPAGYDFPGNECRLLGFRDANNIGAMRLHVWRVFAGMTQMTSAGVPIWETWYSQDEVFKCQDPEQRGAFMRRFSTPEQFKLMDPHLFSQDKPRLLSITFFNQEARDHICNNRLNNHLALNLYNTFFDQLGTATAARNILPFTRESVAVKTAWWLVKRNAITAMPVWDPVTPDQQTHSFRFWPRCVGVDTTHRNVPANEYAVLDCNNHSQRVHLISLNQFYGFQIKTPAQLLFVTNNIPLGENAQILDYVVLAGMHFTTKEIPDWVWATFWWHDYPDSPPYGYDRPGFIRGPWRHYLMNASYSMTTPAEPDGSAHIAFNPWLEGGFAGGIESNCMNCHRQSAWQEPGKPGLPVIERGNIPDDDARFRGSTKLDFIWSIATRSH